MYAIETTDTRSVRLNSKIIERRNNGISWILTNVPSPPETSHILQSNISKLTDIITVDECINVHNKKIFYQENILKIPMFVKEIKGKYLVITAKQIGGITIGPKGKWSKKLFEVFGVDTIHILSPFSITFNINVDMLKKTVYDDILILSDNGLNYIIDITGYL